MIGKSFRSTKEQFANMKIEVNKASNGVRKEVMEEVNRVSNKVSNEVKEVKVLLQQLLAGQQTATSGFHKNAPAMDGNEPQPEQKNN